VRSPLAGPNADARERQRNVDEDQLGGDVGLQPEAGGAGRFGGVARPEPVAVEVDAAIDNVQMAAASRTERVLQPASLRQVRDERPAVLGEVQSVGPPQGP
jgi:hypothetical protein